MNSKTNTVRPFLFVALLTAVVLMYALIQNYLDLGTRLSTTLSDLAVSRESWETTAAEKEALLEQQDTLESNLKIAREPLDNVQKCKEEIETLTLEIAELKEQQPSPEN